MAEKQKEKTAPAPDKNNGSPKAELWYTEIPEEVRDSFIKIGNRRLAIVGFGIKRASRFKAHPLNWRIHPPRQKSAVEGSLNTLGWFDAALENKRTGNLINGHERVENAINNGDAYVPYMQVDLSSEDEAQALLSMDATAALAETDQENVDALLEQVTTDDINVQMFLDEMALDEMASDLDAAPGYEETEKLKPFTMARVLISFPIDAAVHVSDLIDQIELIEGVEIDYGAN